MLKFTPPTERPPAGHVWACTFDGAVAQRCAARVGHFAVVAHGCGRGCSYSITHIPTGMRVPVDCTSRKGAIAAARVLEARSPVVLHALPWGGGARALARADQRAVAEAVAYAQAADSKGKKRC